MNQNKLSVCLKVILAVIGVCGLVVYFLILPTCGESLHASFPEFAAWHWPWLIFLWITAIPCYAALFFGWRIACNIGQDKSFSLEMPVCCRSSPGLLPVSPCITSSEMLCSCS